MGIDLLCVADESILISPVLSTYLRATQPGLGNDRTSSGHPLANRLVEMLNDGLNRVALHIRSGQTERTTRSTKINNMSNFCQPRVLWDTRIVGLYTEIGSP